MSNQTFRRRPSFCCSATLVGQELSVGFQYKVPFDMSRANVGSVPRNAIGKPAAHDQLKTFNAVDVSVGFR
ncbi:MAG: hypothetical protein PGN21_14785 [Sphingomonas paucimobilis]